MSELQIEKLISDGSRVDAVLGRSYFEINNNIHGIPPVQSGLLQVARLAQNNKGRGILVLTNSRLTPERVQSEWESIQRLIHPSLASKIGLVLYQQTDDFQVFGELTKTERNHLDEIVTRSLAQPQSSSPASSEFEVLRVLLINYFRKNGALPIKVLCEESGYSYPTVSKTLKALEPHLNRHSNRSLELAFFPKEAWHRMVATAPKNRSSQGYFVPEGKPRSIEALQKRYQNHIRNFLFGGSEAVASGGIIGARESLPGIDLVGVPRLDLTWHKPTQENIHALLRYLDPALKPVQSGALPQVVIHQLHRPKTFFRARPEHPVADEVETLLDLHEARLDAQAHELLNHLIKQAKS